MAMYRCALNRWAPMLCCATGFAAYASSQVWNPTADFNVNGGNPNGGDGSSDLNEDGGIDGADVQFFFTR